MYSNLTKQGVGCVCAVWMGKRDTTGMFQEIDLDSIQKLMQTGPSQSVLLVGIEAEWVNAVEMTIGTHNDVMSASVGAEAQSIVDEHVPDVVVCDASLSDMSGYDLLRWMRKHPRAISSAFIMIFDNRDYGAVREAMVQGADDFLTRPINAEDLQNAVRTRLHKQEHIRTERETRVQTIRDNVTYSLPHELRTPLAKMLGFGEVLIENIDVVERDEIVDYLETMMQAGRRLEHLIENYTMHIQLDAIASDPAKRASLKERQLTAPAMVLRDVGQKVAARYERMDDLHLDLASAPLRLNHKSLTKLATELIDNAFKFSDAGTSVTVTGSVDEDCGLEDGCFVLTVQDEGRGIEPHHLSWLGQPFMQFDREHFEQQGIGLGFAIARQLVSLHDGRLLVDSQPGVGTQVRVEMPL
jgi:two-component system sensor histidine kinase/response regulator